MFELTGKVAVITPVFDLAAEYVTRVVGPRYRDGKQHEAEQLQSAFEVIFHLAHQQTVQTLALPVLSTGIYNYPKKEVAEILYRVVNRPENQTIKTKIIVLEPTWLPLFEKLIAVSS
ncbi:macro domain-containing protein [Enterococcus viikkiensis]|uniref:Macro domain-containing protein n=1 Tax=Enterococcus viikkiensis TaxID=930854 RepID=A0ABU3FQN2_9ENTE|nr:macro domain-containing protein [Enterococcus viikkiensis]MDT2828284.1 macro domain-containing protein [Enterococcus viikkiensis]